MLPLRPTHCHFFAQAIHKTCTSLASPTTTTTHQLSNDGRRISMKFIQFSMADQVATITMSRPNKLNAICLEMTGEIRAAASEINENDDIRSVILTGEGVAFCAGSDIAEMDHYPTPWMFKNRSHYCDQVRGIRKPVIAAINGFAFGGGLEMALNCDIRIAATCAKFAATEITLGLNGGGGMSAFLTRNIGPSNAALMILAGDPIDAATAEKWGLVTETIDPEELLPRAVEIANRIATRAPIAAQTGKLNLRAATSMSLESAIQYERDLQAVTFATSDAQEGIAAFMEKRPPVFTGR
jgi:enoyl-CoA hydratase/carnithine racemase